ncbi:hypothetical protein [Gemella haemolysans]|uniref:hypothetical protein n=1 Tax=Gemella haemolysans TaxID=1379 RepID=UPI0028D1D6A0|nr:hypothetical protein [Gemella haemolysans]
MKKNSKLLIGLLTMVILAVIGLSAYAYQKQQAMNSNKPKVENKKEDPKLEKFIKDTVSKFDKENDLNKKIEIFKLLVDKKGDVAKENKDKLNSEYNDAIKNIREKLINVVKDKIKNASLNDEDKKNNGKVESVKKELNELQSTLEKEKSVLFEKEEDYNSIAQSIKDALTVLEAPKSTESNQSQQQQEAQAQTQATAEPAPQQPANTYTPSSNSSSNSSSRANISGPSTPANNTVVNETPTNSGSSTVRETPAAPVVQATPTESTATVSSGTGE